MSRPSAVVLLVGLPGSGKTSLCQQLVHHQPICRHICYDELLAPDNNEKWRLARDGVLQQVEDILRHHENSSERLVLLVDDNFYYLSMRRMYYKMAKRHCIPTCIIYLQCNKDLAIQRVHQRKSEGGLFVEENVIIQMAEKLEPPANHSWESFHLLLNAEIEFNPTTIWVALEDLIDSASKSNLFSRSSPETPNTELSTPSYSETCDLALRNIISSEMQSARSRGLSTPEMSQLAQQLNSQRKLLLRQIGDASVTEVVDQFRLCLDKNSSTVHAE
ncbi:L-seryl-tRNA(Sec) kinase [Cloeon dipterum]|uniref:L-seryl-tRNA(Sec) kinase n=1 Tax=Cloeon dipterum TaxID=197152 RepID=UPI00321FD81F